MLPVLPGFICQRTYPFFTRYHEDEMHRKQDFHIQGKNEWVLKWFDPNFENLTQCKDWVKYLTNAVIKANSDIL